VLRKRFKGTPEHVINYFFFVAEELREPDGVAWARARSTNLVGRSDLLDQEAPASTTGRRRASISPSCSTSPSPIGGDTLYHSEFAEPPSGQPCSTAS
jgi:hypothetical protein